MNTESCAREEESTVESVDEMTDMRGRSPLQTAFFVDSCENNCFFYIPLRLLFWRLIVFCTFKIHIEMVQKFL